MASAIEFDSRPGQVRDLIAELSRSWLDAIETEARYAQTLGQLDTRVDTAQLAFELHALVDGANWYFKLFQDKRAFDQARTGILDRLRQGATPALFRLLGEKSATRKTTAKRTIKRKESR